MDTPIKLDLHPRQTQAYLSSATEILFGGAAGGGKSHLMRVVAIMLCVEVKGIQVYLFRRLSDDLYKNHMEGPGGFLALLGDWLAAKLVRYNGAKNYLEFWTGAKIWLSHCQHEKDLAKYQGPEIHALLIDELTHFSETMYRYLRGRCRLGGLVVPEKYRGKLPLVLAGSNPGGVGHNWVKRTFVDAAPEMDVQRTEKKDGGMLRQYIPSLIEDNPTLLENDPDYLDRLEGLGNKTLVRAMRFADWNIVAGGALDDVWSDRLILPRFKIPRGWRIDRSFDWGSTHPFSVGWWAEADGTEAKIGDNVFCPPRGSLIRIHEWYGTREVGTNEGIKASPTAIAKGVADYEKALLEGEWIPAPPRPGPADNQIRSNPRHDQDTIEQTMAKAGIRWTESDKSPGSRINGLELLRERMIEASKDYPESPGIYFMEHCRAAISTLPTLPRDSKKPDDVDTNAEDHVYDDIRYRVLASKRAAMTIKLRVAS